jgi:membrane protein YdbS with pleckstrin-like domain
MTKRQIFWLNVWLVPVAVAFLWASWFYFGAEFDWMFWVYVILTLLWPVQLLQNYRAWQREERENQADE